MRRTITSAICSTLIACAGPRPPAVAPPVSPPGAGSTTARPSTPTTAPGAVVILLDEGEFHYGADGRKRTTYRLRYRIAHESALESWNKVVASWSPWHEKRPVLEATVELPSGRRLELDPKTIEESSLRGSSDTFTDRRLLRAPLPGVVVGAVVERTMVLEDTKPFFVGGELQRFFFGAGVDVEVARAIIDVPAEAPLVFRTHGVDIAPIEDKTANGRRRLVFETGRLPGDAGQLDNLPADIAAPPHLAFSMAGSWLGLAETYAGIIDKQIVGANVGDIAAAAGSGARIDKIRRMVARLHAKIRYTGIEFGVNAIVPVTPATVLERGFGDCKDKAALLVAALRRHGIESHVALLNAGFGADAPDIAGLNVFNHAIVYIPGETPLWIDATADRHPVGAKPLAIQGRRALIARRGQDRLVEIPKSSSKDNVYRETRAITMANLDEGGAVETTHGTGSMDAWVRREFATARDEALVKSIGGYVKRTYVGKLVGVPSRENVDDVTKPMTLRVEVDEAQISMTNDFDGSVVANLNALFSFLPGELTRVPAKGEEPKPRTVDFALFNPYRAELRYEIEMPRGFVPRSLPETKEVPMGPATLNRSYTVDGRFLKVRYHFDSGPRRWSGADVGAFNAAYRECIVEETILMDHEGARAIADGKVKSGLDVHRASVAAEPNVAAHHVRLAQGLLAAGFGDEGRRAARRAAKLAPKDFYAQFILGYALSTDFFGRPNLVPNDRSGALEAYRRAQVLAPKRLAVWRNMAVLLESNDLGQRYAPRVDLRSAATVYRTVRDELDDHSLDLNLVHVLVRLGELDEAEQVAKALAPSANRNALLFVVVTLRRGAEEARRSLRSLGHTSSETAAASEAAGKVLVAIRAYAAAADVLESSGGKGAGLEARAFASRLRQIKPFEKTLSATTGPKAVMLRVMKWMVSRGATAEELNALRSKDSRVEERRRTKHAGTIEERMRNRFPPIAGLSEADPTATFLDAAFSFVAFTHEGSDELGYCVTGKNPEDKVGGRIFVLKEGDEYKVRALNFEFGSVGAQVLTFLDRKKTKAAYQWLDWIAKAQMPSTLRTRFKAVWPRKGERTVTKARYAAAVLAAFDVATAHRADAILTQRNDELDAVAQTMMLVAAIDGHLELGRYDRALTQARKAYEIAPENEEAKEAFLDALEGAGRGPELRVALTAAIGADPKDAWLRNRLFTCLAGILGDFVAAQEALDDAIDSGIELSALRNARAWNGLFLESRPSNIVDDALAAARKTEFMNTSDLHTLATVYAETDQPEAALQAIRRTYDRRGGAMAAHDWFVIGRIAESYDLRDAAKRAYKRVEPSSKGRKNGTLELAKRRLEGMR